MSVAQIISLWPSAEVFADEIGLKYRSHARVMKARGRIARHHWAAIVKAAKKRGLSVTVKDLENAHVEAA